EQMLHPPLIPIVLARVCCRGGRPPAIPEVVIDGRPAAAAPIKKSPRVGMTAFLRPVNFFSENQHDLPEERPFRFCWQGRSARADEVGCSTAAYAPRAATRPQRRRAANRRESEVFLRGFLARELPS